MRLRATVSRTTRSAPSCPARVGMSSGAQTPLESSYWCALRLTRPTGYETAWPRGLGSCHSSGCACKAGLREHRHGWCAWWSARQSGRRAGPSASRQGANPIRTTACGFGIGRAARDRMLYHATPVSRQALPRASICLRTLYRQAGFSKIRAPCAIRWTQDFQRGPLRNGSGLSASAGTSARRYGVEFRPVSR